MHSLEGKGKRSEVKVRVKSEDRSLTEGKRRKVKGKSALEDRSRKSKRR